MATRLKSVTIEALEFVVAMQYIKMAMATTEKEAEEAVREAETGYRLAAPLATEDQLRYIESFMENPRNIIQRYSSPDEFFMAREKIAAQIDKMTSEGDLYETY